jgi:hypothetical protein
MKEREYVMTCNEGERCHIQSNGSLAGSATIPGFARKKFIVSAFPKDHQIIKLRVDPILTPLTDASNGSVAIAERADVDDQNGTPSVSMYRGKSKSGIGSKISGVEQL